MSVCIRDNVDKLLSCYKWNSQILRERTWQKITYADTWSSSFPANICQLSLMTVCKGNGQKSNGLGFKPKKIELVHCNEPWVKISWSHSGTETYLKNKGTLKDLSKWTKPNGLDISHRMTELSHSGTET